MPAIISNPHSTMAVLIPVFQMKNLRLRYMNVFVQGRKQSQESNPKLSASKGPSVFYRPTGPALFLTGWSLFADQSPGQVELRSLTQWELTFCWLLSCLGPQPLPWKVFLLALLRFPPLPSPPVQSCLPPHHQKERPFN